MPNYIIAYHGGKQPATKEEGAAHMQKWQAWMQGLGDAVVTPPSPLGQSAFINSDGVSMEPSPDALTGFLIFAAEDMDAAIEIAKADPFCDMGTIELAEVRSMGG